MYFHFRIFTVQETYFHSILLLCLSRAFDLKDDLGSELEGEGIIQSDKIKRIIWDTLLHGFSYSRAHCFKWVMSQPTWTGTCIEGEGLSSWREFFAWVLLMRCRFDEEATVDVSWAVMDHSTHNYTHGNIYRKKISRSHQKSRFLYLFGSNFGI